MKWGKAWCLIYFSRQIRDVGRGLALFKCYSWRKSGGKGEEPFVRTVVFRVCRVEHWRRTRTVRCWGLLCGWNVQQVRALVANPENLNSIPKTLTMKPSKLFPGSGLHMCVVAFGSSSLHKQKSPVMIKKIINASNMFMVETRKNRYRFPTAVGVAVFQLIGI